MLIEDGLYCATSCLFTQAQTFWGFKALPHEWIKLLNRNHLLLTKVSCHCSFLRSVFSIVKKDIIVLPNATEMLQLFWRVFTFQNISAKAVMYLAFHTDVLFLKLFQKASVYHQLVLASTENLFLFYRLPLCVYVVFVLFCFLDYSISLHSVNYLWIGNSR